MNSFKIFTEEKLPDKKYFYNSVKDETTGDNGKILDGHISNEDHLTYNKTGNAFNMKNMGGFYDHYLKKDVLLLAYVFESLLICAPHFTSLIFVLILVLLD